MNYKRLEISEWSSNINSDKEFSSLLARISSCFQKTLHFSKTLVFQIYTTSINCNKGRVMIATAKDLRFNINMLFDVLSKGEEVTITYRGKPKAKLISTEKNTTQKDDSLFGLWKDMDKDVDIIVRDMRKGRDFAL